MDRTNALTIILALLGTLPVFAGEVAVDPGDNGTDIVEDTTEDADSRSSEVAAAVEHLLDTPVPEAELPVIPLADAVTAPFRCH